MAQARAGARGRDPAAHSRQGRNRRSHPRDALGDYPRARTLFQEALALADAVHDPALTGVVLSHFGALAVLQGEAAEARVLLERSVALHRGTDDHRQMPRALIALGRSFVLLDELERAEVVLNEGVDLARRHGSTLIMGFAVFQLAHLKLRRRDYGAAITLALEALRAARAGSSWRGIVALSLTSYPPAPPRRTR